MPDTEQRLREKLLTNISVDDNSCWVWTGRKNHRGYGRVSYEGRDIGAHRVSYMVFVGPIPPGLTIDHLCRNRLCINPSHLEAVSNRVNVLRGEGISATNARKTHCKRGHPFDEENTYYHSNGARECLECKRMLKRKWERRLRREQRQRKSQAN